MASSLRYLNPSENVAASAETKRVVHAMLSNDISTVRTAMQQGVRIPDVHIPLHELVQYGYDDMIRLVLAHHPTLVRTVIQNGDAEGLHWLLDHGYVWNVQSEFEFAVRLGHSHHRNHYGIAQCVRLLLEYIPNALTYEDLNNALCTSAQVGNARVVELLLDIDGVDINYHRGRPLIEAARYGNTDVVRALLARGADVHVRNGVPLYLVQSNEFLHTLQGSSNRRLYSDQRDAAYREIAYLLLDYGTHPTMGAHPERLRSWLDQMDTIRSTLHDACPYEDVNSIVFNQLYPNYHYSKAVTVDELPEFKYAVDADGGDTDTIDDLFEHAQYATDGDIDDDDDDDGFDGYHHNYEAI